MEGKFNIVIIGIGGVGGYLGARLADHYRQYSDVAIYFIARGENEKAIHANGLKLITPEETIIARPRKLSADPTAIGRMDLVICCIKSYHLEDSIRSLVPCIDADTMILPLLNGVDAKERISKILPGIPVLDGCIYLVSRLIAPGVVEKRGNVQQVYFGSSQHSKSKLKQVETIFQDAGIDATLLTEIGNRCWEKFFFISTIATLTSYLDKTIGEIIANEAYRQKLLSLMKEFQAVAGKKMISLPENIIDKSFDTLASLPYDATSSMHTDFKKGNQTELKSITAYVVLLGKELGVATPVYEEMLMTLLKR